LFTILVFLIFPALAYANTGSPAGSPDCSSQNYRIVGVSLEPLVLNGSVITMNSAACTPVTANAIVVFSQHSSAMPLVKRVVAMPGDRFGLENGVLHVNGAVVRNSAGAAYEFAAARGRMLELYAHDYNGIIPPNTYLVLGDNIAGTLDSSRFGFITRADIQYVAERSALPHQ
jgi:signal peptidase I